MTKLPFEVRTVGITPEHNTTFWQELSQQVIAALRAALDEEGLGIPKIRKYTQGIAIYWIYPEDLGHTHILNITPVYPDTKTIAWLHGLIKPGDKYSGH